MLYPNRIAVFGMPRTGTKLLRSIFKEQLGYLDFGEVFTTFYDSNTGEKIDNREAYIKYHHVTVEIKPTDEQIEFYKKRTKFKSIKSIVTIFSAYYDEYPGFEEVVKDHYFLCPRREDNLEQLLSIVISKKNNNYAGTTKAVPVIIDLKDFDYYYNLLTTSLVRQEQIVREGRGRFIDFDKLIRGEEDLGFKYRVTSKDEHEDLKALTINYDEVKAHYDTRRS